MIRSPAHLLPTAFSLALLAGLLLASAFTVPFVHVNFEPQFPSWLPDFMGSHELIRDWLVDVALIPTGPQTLPAILQGLLTAEEHFVFASVFVFSVVFPMLKCGLTALLALSPNRPGPTARARLIHLLGGLGKWSMADVFIVGLLIVTLKAEALQFRYEAGPGLYAYAGSALLAAGAAHLLLKHAQALRRRYALELAERLFAEGRRLRGDAPGDLVREAAVFLRDQGT